jgi:lambda family phage portal protein
MSRAGDFFKRLFSGAKQGEANPLSNPFLRPASEPTSISAFLQPSRGALRTGGTGTGAKWDFGLSANGVSPLLDNYLLRQNSRSAIHDSVEYRAMVTRLADSVVDRGLRLVPEPASAMLGLTEDEAAEWGEGVSDRFHAWARQKSVDVAGNMNLYQLQRFANVSQTRDGEYFARLYYGAQDGLVNPLQIGFVDPNDIQGTAGLTSTIGFNHYLDSGIERDQYGREVAYHFYSWTGKDYVPQRIPATTPNGMPLVLHGFRAEYANQVRGFPEFSHCLQEFENLTDFKSAHIKKAINQSQLVLSIEAGDNGPSDNVFEAITQAKTGPSSSNVSPTASVVDTGTQFSYQVIEEAASGTPGSTVVYGLDSGEKLRPFVNTAPADGFDAFVDSFAAYLSASNSIPIEVVLMRFNASYSASRASLMLFWRVAQIWRDEQAADLLDTVYTAWLWGEIAAGRVMARGFSDPALRAAWTQCAWSGVPMPNIDPAKTAKADEIYVKLGAQSLDAVAQNFSGSRYKQNRAKLERQYDGHPIPPWEKVGQAPAPVQLAEPSRASVTRDTEDQDDEQKQEEENDNGKSRRDSMR